MDISQIIMTKYSHGLLIVVDAKNENSFLNVITEAGLSLDCIGNLAEINLDQSLITIA